MLAATTVGTWGLTGAQVLWGYGSVCAIGAMVVWQEHKRVLGPAASGYDPQADLGAYRLALMSGGPDRAIIAAAAQLLRDRRLTGTGGTLEASSKASAADPLEREVLEAVRREPGISVEEMHSRVRHSFPLVAMTEQMTHSGLLLEASDVRRMRLLWIVPALLAAIGLAVIFTGGVDGSGATVGVVFALVVAAAVLATLRLAGVRPRATNRGRGLLERERRALSPRRRHPAASEIGLMTALYGGGALWLADPVTAARLGVPRDEDPAGGGGWTAGWGGDGGVDGGGGGCGGGGGGGGCGGGGGS